ncbi:MAG: c-type cytochrome [Acidobacteria bacterium]|nr:c-type cytochrome [Acidobacteriota bacterium]
MRFHLAFQAFIVFFLFAIISGNGASGISSQSAGTEKPAEEQFKNIQVFRGLPASRLMDAMFYMRGALGVNCTHCHVNFSDFEKDDKQEKQTARKMIRMMNDLNQAQFHGESVITCNTCHRGQATPTAPLTFARIAREEHQPVQSGSPGSSNGAADAVSVEKIFERYIAASGGQAKQGALRTRIMKGTISSSEGWSVPLTIYCKAPSKYLTTFDLGKNWISYQATNGVTAWNQDNNGIHQTTGKKASLLQQEAALFQPLALKAQYSDLALAGTQTIDGHEADKISAVLPGVGVETLYFDRQSGLLIRITSSQVTPLGPLLSEINIKDYRELRGVKVPFQIERLAPDFSSSFSIASVKLNHPVDDKNFERPPSVLKTSE